MKRSILLAIFLLNATPAMADDIVRIRSDGKMINETGKVIAIPNTNDTRNNQLRRYYQSLDSKGNARTNSDFYIINDPLKGLVKVDVNAQPGQSAKAADSDSASQESQDSMVKKYDGSQTLIKSPDAPIYNDVNNNIETVY